MVTEIVGGLTHAHGIGFDNAGKVGYISDGGAGAISPSNPKRRPAILPNSFVLVNFALVWLGRK
jgi:hypothetical protein